MALYDEIKQLEDSISKSQQELSRIMYHYNRADEKDEVLRQQILNCKENIEVLTTQLNKLESQMNMQLTKRMVKQQPAVQQTAAVPVAQPTPAQSVQAKPAVQPKPQPKKKEKQSFESLMGTSGMGIIASALIFISFVLFAALLYPNLTDTVKLISLFGVSGLFIGIGMWKLHSKPKNPLWLSVTATGVGGVYLALFLSVMLFNVMGYIPLYILLTVWCVGVCLLSKYKSNFFQIIGYIGVFISVLLGADLCAAKGDDTLTLSLFIYSIVAMLILRIFHNDREYYKNWPAFLLSTANILLMTDFCSKKIWAGTFILLAYIILELVYHFVFGKTDKRAFIFTGAVMVYTINLIALVLIAFRVQSNLACALIALAILLIVHVLVEIKKVNPKSVSYYFMLAIFTIAYLIMFYYLYDTEGIVIPQMALAIAYMVWSKFSHKISYKWMGFVAALVALFSTYLGAVVYLVMAVLYIAAFYLTEYVFTEKYDQVYAPLNYCLSLVLTAMAVGQFSQDYQWDNSTTFLVISLVTGVVNLLAMFTKILNNPVEKKRDSSIYVISVIVNKFFMLFALVGMTKFNNWWFLPLTAAFFSATTGKLLSKDKFWSSFYVGLKYTILIVAVMAMADISGLWFSLIFFVLAIASIILGFVIKRKGLRVYGLILSLISVVKLILIDIDYDNSIMRAASFFICGILCFVISFIYNLVDKKMKSQVIPEEVKEGIAE